MINFNTLTNFLNWPWISQRCDLGKQFNLVVRLDNVLKISLQDVLKTSWRHMAKTNILVLTKTSWRCLEDVFIKTNVCWVYLKKCFLESKTLPSINRYPIYKEKKNILEKKQKKQKQKQNKTQFSMVKSQLMVYQNE